MVRSSEDYSHELNALDAAHAQNESSRDAFVALAHTALFASSVAFVGDVTSLNTAIWRPAIILGWAASVVGLLALTVSFGVARRTIDARRAALNDDEPPSSGILEFLNGVSLWSFPAALLCLFAFVTANMVNADDRRADPSTPSSAPSTGTDREGDHAITKSTDLEPGRAEARDGRGPSPKGTGGTPAAPATSATSASSG